jgi:hypothetical protein
VILNSFEIAILRILVKRNQFPITIHGLIEGFPDGSENNVVSAISNLRDLNYVFIMPGDPKEEENIVYNLEKKNEILKIIDPLQEIKIENGSGEKHAKKIDEGNKNNKNQNYVLDPIKILISAVFIISFGMVTSSMPTTNDNLHIIDDNIHHHYLKYGEAYGNNGDYYPKSFKGKVAGLSFDGEYDGDKAIDGLHHPACYRT